MKGARQRHYLRWIRLEEDVIRSTVWGLLLSGALLLAIYFGSSRLRHFDAALVQYAGAAVLACFGLGYRYAMWLRRPPTRMYWFSGWLVFLHPSRLPRNLVRLFRLLCEDFFAQRFIGKRSQLRWAAHWFIAWGSILAAAVTFPLSFGWVHFQNAPGNQHMYQAFAFGWPVFRFQLGTVTAFLTFNVLNISAVMVLAGVALALWRRSRDRGAIAFQHFAQDMMPLVMLFAISITGLFLSASAHLLHGLNYGFLSLLHAVTVILTLLYLPFGKFFHIFQRPAQLGVQFYKDEGRRGEQAHCSSCKEPFASLMHVNDLKEVEKQLNIEYTLAQGRHYQDVCPACRRKSVALTQDSAWREQSPALNQVLKQAGEYGQTTRNHSGNHHPIRPVPEPHSGHGLEY